MPILFIVIGFQALGLAVVVALSPSLESNDALWRLAVGCVAFDGLILMTEVILVAHAKRLGSSSALIRTGQVFSVAAAVAVFALLLVPECSQATLLALGATNFLLAFPFLAEAKTWRD